MVGPEGKTLARQTIATPLGDLIMLSDETTLLVLEFADVTARVERVLRRRFGEAAVAAGDPLGVRASLDAYFAGDLRVIDGIQVDGGGTPFQRRVWSALRMIPCGTTTSYGRLAEMLGQPSATRAVGLANGANPIAIVVPCHRVIGSDGSLTGYGGGMRRKRWLLEHEGVFTRSLPLA